MSSEQRRSAAFFDVDGTLTRTTVIEPLVWYQRERLPTWRFGPWLAGLVMQAPYYLWLDRRSRADFNRAFFRRYRGLNVADLAEWHRQAFPRTIQRRLFPQALDCLRRVREEGRAVVLVTGGLDWVMRPLAEYLQVDHLFALQLRDAEGVCTGELAVPPLAEEQKAILVRQYARENGIDLGRSEAYGDSVGDLPMLECVGQPVAVNPSQRLRAVAESRGWRIESWKLTS